MARKKHVKADRKSLKETLSELERFSEGVNEATLLALSYTGEESVKRAREEGNYKDRTGNLRSSIGYRIMGDGHVLAESEPVTFTTEEGGDGHDGPARMREHLDSLMSDQPDGTTLRVVAGMEYASHVEKAHGRIVISSARLWADGEFPRIMREYADKTLKDR